MLYLISHGNLKASVKVVSLESHRTWPDGMKTHSNVLQSWTQNPLKDLREKNMLCIFK